MSKRLNKKQKKNGSSRKRLERKNIKLTTEIEELDKTLNGYQKVKKELEKELTELRVYERLGEIEENIDYKELTKGINIKGILEMAMLEKIVEEKDTRIITPEEYREKYGEVE